MKKSLLLLFAYCFFNVSARENIILNPYSASFIKAYNEHTSIPNGILEAIAFTNTRFQHITHNSGDAESCVGIPNVYGVMGLTLDGKKYFRNNLLMISDLSGYSVKEIISNPQINILAFAKAYASIQATKGIGNQIEEQVQILAEMSELPNMDLQQNFALNSHLYSVYTFLNNPEFQKEYGITSYNISLEKIFGKENLKVLSSSYVNISDEKISNKEGEEFQKSTLIQGASTDYAPALWNPTTCNFSSRNGTAISAVAIHDIEGSYAGAISWFKNCASQVSAHYVLRSSDGQVTQMVLESDKAWHIGSENPYTIGLEHEGYANQTGWYTTAMYNSSANLVRDITNSGYGINPLRCWGGASCNGSCVLGACIKIKGHQHFPNQTHTDPGPNWDWALYYKLINNAPTTSTLTTCTGNFYDSGGSSANYGNDERYVKVISPTGATSVILTFTAFNTESGYDYLYIYNGNSINAPLIGKYSGTASPGTVTGTSGSLCLEFRSDCATVSSGWTANWTCTVPSTTLTIGTGTSQTITPYGTYYMDEKSQFIITKSELVAAGYNSSQNILKSLAFNVASASSQAMNGFSIKIGHTTSTSYGNTYFKTSTSMVTVFSGTKTAATGWNTHTFSTPFTYNGVDNLLIEICWNNSSYTTNSKVYAAQTSAYTTLYKQQDVSSGGICGITTGGRSYYRPNMKLVFGAGTTSKLFAEEDQEAIIENPEFIAGIYPVPASDFLNVDYSIEQDKSSFSISIYNMMGQLLKYIDLGEQAAGEYSIKIELNEQSGKRIINGIYICSFSTNGIRNNKTFVISD